MGCCSGRTIKKQLTSENYIHYSKRYDQYIFSKCGNIRPKSLSIYAKQTKHNWQVGFFDADGEVYFDKIILEYGASFSNLVRNYWWNGKEGNEKREGYYSLIKSVRKLVVCNKQQINDLLNYVEDRYKVGEHWQIHRLGRNIELIIEYGTYVKETVIEQLSKYFDNIYCSQIIVDLKTINNITYNGWYEFKNCKGVVPQELVINATVEKICFRGAGNEVHIPKIMMEEKANLKDIIQNKYGRKYKREKCYSTLPYVQTLVIRNNPKVLCDLADYINGRYKTYYGWKLQQLNKNMKIMIEKPGIAFGAVKEISDYFADVLVDDNNPQEYLARQQPYQKQFQEHFDKYDLETDQIENFIPANQELWLRNEKLNVGSSNRRINELHVNQKIEKKQFVCFHDTDKPVAINKIVIENGGDLRCVLQNAYYNGMDARFFSLLRTAKELQIHSNYNGDNQVLVDLADYIERKYVLNANWKQEELDNDMKITINSGGYSLSLGVARRLRNYFKNVLIDRIYTPLETENVIDQECEDQYIFTRSGQVSPQKLVINAKQMGKLSLILFNQADDKIDIPEIIIDEQGCFAAVMRNAWQNNKESDKKRFGFYSLVQHVETLTIRNNSIVLMDFADYVVGKYVIGYSDWKVQQLSKDIKIMIQGPMDAFLPVLKISKHFNDITVNEKQPENDLVTWELQNNPDYKAQKTCFWIYGLLMKPLQYSVKSKKKLKLVGCVYNIRKSMASIYSLIVRQKLDINQFICFHDIDQAVAVNEIVIDDVGNLRSVLQNAYYSNGQGGFLSLLGTAKKLKINDNEQAMEDLADYIDGKYTLHPRWRIQALDRNMVIKLHHNSRAFSLDVARRLRSYFKNVSIYCIYTPLETENIIDQECENKYVFVNCRDTNPQKLVVNAKLAGIQNLILFNGANSEVCIPEITICEHGHFNAIVRNYWHNRKGGDEIKYGYYSLVSHVETLTIQNNPQAVRDMDRYIFGNYRTKKNIWKVQKICKNIIVRINGVNGLDEEVNRLSDYFSYIFVDGRKVLGTQRRGAITSIKLDSDKIQQQSTANADKHSIIARADAEIAETRQRINRARARLGRRRARFQEYLALAE